MTLYQKFTSVNKTTLLQNHKIENISLFLVYMDFHEVNFIDNQASVEFDEDGVANATSHSVYEEADGKYGR